MTEVMQVFGIRQVFGWAATVGGVLAGAAMALLLLGPVLGFHDWSREGPGPRSAGSVDLPVLPVRGVDRPDTGPLGLGALLASARGPITISAQQLDGAPPATRFRADSVRRGGDLVPVVQAPRPSLPTIPSSDPAPVVTPPTQPSDSGQPSSPAPVSTPAAEAPVSTPAAPARSDNLAAKRTDQTEKASAERERYAEKQEVVAQKLAEKQTRAAEKQAAQDQKAAEKQAAQDQKAAEKQAAQDQKAAEKQAAETAKATEKQAAETEKQAAKADKQAEKADKQAAKGKD